MKDHPEKCMYGIQICPTDASTCINFIDGQNKQVIESVLSLGYGLYNLKNNRGIWFA